MIWLAPAISKRKRHENDEAYEGERMESWVGLLGSRVDTPGPLFASYTPMQTVYIQSMAVKMNFQ